MREFADLLAEVLTDGRYKNWLESKFTHIDPWTREDFAMCAREPEYAINRVRNLKRTETPRFMPAEFSTALAVDVAATYPGEAAIELPRLIETIFAKPFCQHEKAEGRYGRLLQPLPEIRTEKDVAFVNVDLNKKILLRLPSPRAGFADIINTVRGNSGKRLREEMKVLGNEPKFESARNAWLAVADELASLVSAADMKEIKVETLSYRIARGTEIGVLVDLLIEKSGADLPGVGILAGPLLCATLDVGIDHIKKLNDADRRREEIADWLGKAVDFSCVRHDAD